ncbi:MAG: TetR/AcrR family transcriptional regulator [Candidatus Rokubacteria bacterium]|nr:TetR/AcrR family transcriptional regulator [Candidatus Rokubacteria bacterium]
MREAIVEAAGRCIVARGHAALSTRGVASEAGVNQSLIHYYFGTKERLMLAVLERMNQRLLKRQAEMFEAPGDVADKWAQACRFYEDDLRSGYVRLLTELSALGVSNAAIGEEVRKLRGQWRALLERVVGDALQQFAIRSVSTEQITAYLVAFWYGMEMEMVLGVPEEESHYRASLATFGRFLRWLETQRREGRPPTLA